jgi:hypothetical protein
LDSEESDSMALLVVVLVVGEIFGEFWRGIDWL